MFENGAQSIDPDTAKIPATAITLLNGEQVTQIVKAVKIGCPKVIISTFPFLGTVSFSTKAKKSVPYNGYKTNSINIDQIRFL